MIFHDRTCKRWSLITYGQFGIENRPEAIYQTLILLRIIRWFKLIIYSKFWRKKNWKLADSTVRLEPNIDNYDTKLLGSLLSNEGKYLCVKKGPILSKAKLLDKNLKEYKASSDIKDIIEHIWCKKGLIISEPKLLDKNWKKYQASTDNQDIIEH